MTSFWVGDALVPPSDARVSVLDHGLTVGDGVFETILVRDGVPFALTRHLARLGRSTTGLGIRPVDQARVREAVAAVVGSAGDDAVRARLRITVTSGVGPFGSDRGDAEPDPRRDADPRVAVAAHHDPGHRAVGAQRTVGHRRAQDHVVRRERRGAGRRAPGRRL